MATPDFVYQDPLPIEKDTTHYRLLSKDYVSVTKFEGKDILKIEPEGLTLLANVAIRDVSFLLRTAHLEKVAAILKDPQASDNDRYVALAMLRNADTAAKGILPFCQDTGTATIFGKKGQQVWTGVKDEEHLAKGIYKTYTEENLRYSQTAPLNMYDEVDTGTNLPAQIDLMATEGMEYQFLFVTKGGGSANKTTLYQETKALLNPASLEKFLTDKMKTLGTAGCPPYHLVFVIGGTSAEACLKTVKLGIHRLSRSSADHRQRAWPGVSRRGDRKSDAPASVQVRLRRAVRRQIFRFGCADHSPAAPRRVVPGRHGRFLFGGSQRQSEDQQRRHLARRAGARSGPADSGRLSRQGCEQRRQSRSQSADGRNPCATDQASGDDAACR